MFGAVVKPPPVGASKSSNSKVTVRWPSLMVNLSLSFRYGVPLPSSSRRGAPARRRNPHPKRRIHARRPVNVRWLREASTTCT